jgi:4-hydroxy-tetrahydrodipicolinate synthase
MAVSKNEAKAWGREAVRGLWSTPMIPLTADGEVDHQGIRDNVEYIIGTKADGVGFGFSEPWYLSLDERMAAFKTFIDAVDKRIPCYVHAIDYAIPETVRLSNYVRELGADAVMWWAPIEFAHSDEEAAEWYEVVASQVDMPVFAYNTYHSGRNLSLDTLERIAQIPNVVALKDAVNDYSHTIAAMERFGDLVVVSNPIEEYLASMVMNTKQQVLLGTTSVFLMQSPEAQPVHDYVQAAAAGDHESAWQQYYALKPLRDLWNDIYKVLWVKEAASHPIPLIKWWMDLAGMKGGTVRRPLKNLTESERRQFTQRVEATGWADKLWPNRSWAV